MTKEEFIDYVNRNNYQYCENKDTINIDKIVDDLNNVDVSITYDKKDQDIQLWLSENGSGTAHTLDKFEIEVIKYLGSVKMK